MLFFCLFQTLLPFPSIYSSCENLLPSPLSHGQRGEWQGEKPLQAMVDNLFHMCALAGAPPPATRLDGMAPAEIGLAINAFWPWHSASHMNTQGHWQRHFCTAYWFCRGNLNSLGEGGNVKEGKRKSGWKKMKRITWGSETTAGKVGARAPAKDIRLHQN